MKLAIMQPYFLPYIGYFQLIAAVDSFVVYDNIKYTKKGWISRNRLLQNDRDALFSLPLKAGPDAADIRERELAADFDRRHLLNRFKESYRRAPQFSGTWALLESIIMFENRNLFEFLYHSLTAVCAYIGIETPLVISSRVPADHSLRGQDRVLSICKAAGALTYINSIGGMNLYDRATFGRHGTELLFLKPRPPEYPQFGAPFVPSLSIVDVMMFNSPADIRSSMLGSYDLV